MQMPGNRRRGQALATQGDDLDLDWHGEPARAAVRPRRAISQAHLTFNGVAVTPLAHSPGRNPMCLSDCGDRPAARQSIHHQHSTAARSSRSMRLPGCSVSMLQAFMSEGLAIPSRTAVPCREVQLSDQDGIDSRSVFVVHGRHLAQGLFDFLRAIDLKPLEWNTVAARTGNTAPYIFDMLRVGF